MESLGGAVALVLEAFYLCLYAIPPICMGVLYVEHRRDRIDRFLTMLFLGYLSALTRCFRTFRRLSPRIAFPGRIYRST